MSTLKTRFKDYLEFSKHVLINWILIPEMVIFATILILSGCNSSSHESTPTASPEPEFVDISYLTGIPCSPPCWYGLIPGESSEDEVVKTVESLSFIDPESLRTLKQQWNYSTESTLLIYDYKYPPGTGCCSFEVALNKLRRISINPIIEISFSEVVNSLGPPDNVIVFPIDKSSCGIGLTWIDKQIYIGIETEWDLCNKYEENLRMDPDLIITFVEYLTMEEINGTSEYPLYPWEGFLDE